MLSLKIAKKQILHSEGMRTRGILFLSSTVRNKQSIKRFIGLRWSTINRLLDSIFDENLFLLK